MRDLSKPCVHQVLKALRLRSRSVDANFITYDLAANWACGHGLCARDATHDMDTRRESHLRLFLHADHALPLPLGALRLALGVARTVLVLTQTVLAWARTLHALT